MGQNQHRGSKRKLSECEPGPAGQNIWTTSVNSEVLLEHGYVTDDPNPEFCGSLDQETALNNFIIVQSVIKCFRTS